MIELALTPHLNLLSEEYVLVQAWKKTSAYIRYHNWYSDTLELDRTSVNLPSFLEYMSQKLSDPYNWENDPLRIVLAPKSQQWAVEAGTQQWKPKEPNKKIAAKLRPLAHVSIKDQVAATAMMLCLADRVETLQGDTRDSISTREKRSRVISYGNRLFCDAEDPEDNKYLQHRWGTTTLYRNYFQDYTSFISRPEVVAESIAEQGDYRVVIVQSDLRQFYDRVRPSLLYEKIESLARPGDDPSFFALARRLLNWGWHHNDLKEVEGYSKAAGMENFTEVALPQGLVSAGFFANVVLLDFDQALRNSLDQEISSDVILEDVCRYVDDLRLVLTVNSDLKLSKIEHDVAAFLQQLLNDNAIGLEPSKEKTLAAVFGGDERPLVRQSRRMTGIQSATSGGFDAIRGQDILNTIQGLVSSQRRFSEQRQEGKGWSLSPIPDVRDATVARFAAARFRSTYRSLRPLLDKGVDGSRPTHESSSNEDTTDRFKKVLTQPELDDEVRTFALGLIENWVEDPSNVRLLRIGLDLWPSKVVLEKVLGLLRPFTEKGGKRRAARRVAWYCLADIFRAGATETGFVEDSESLPDAIDIDAYRAELRKEAVRLASVQQRSLPWYLKQQVLLFLSANSASEAPITLKGKTPETKHYREFILFLKGNSARLTLSNFATLAILARRSYSDKTRAIKLVNPEVISPSCIEKIIERDPSFGLEILENEPGLIEDLTPRLRDDLCLGSDIVSDGWESLPSIVLDKGPTSPLRNELSLLHFANLFLQELPEAWGTKAITPSNIQVEIGETKGPVTEVKRLRISSSRVDPSRSIYCPPSWCSDDEQWRFQLGYLLRFILLGRQDFTRGAPAINWREGTAAYRKPENHWYQRLYGLFSGQPAFGDDWLPISDWTEWLLYALLRWPGCYTPENLESVKDADTTRRTILNRINKITGKLGTKSSTLMIPFKAPRPSEDRSERTLRGCVVQTVIPTPDHFHKSDDLTLSSGATRKQHRNHLSTALAAVERMLYLRETHLENTGYKTAGQLDWLILPELSVHPKDVQTHLVPFARAHKTIILAGLVYEELFRGQPLVNSALWVIPKWSPANGLQIITRRQGKFRPAPEEKLQAGSRLQGFRPCQWLIGYNWAKKESEEPPLWLSASICYDATDISLAADLRLQSDIFAITALNKDVSTFDQMALALHYHMYQMVIVANNGTFGGSNAYVPFENAFKRQVFHLHGQPQASMAFFEINNIAEFIKRRTNNPEKHSESRGNANKCTLKSPPAGIGDDLP